MAEISWHSLKVGDRVQLKHWPSEIRKETLGKETRELYEWLLERAKVIEVTHFDSYGLPYGDIVDHRDNSERWHYLALNHSGFTIAKEQ